MKLSFIDSNNSAKDYHEVSSFLNCHPIILKWSLDLEDFDNLLRVLN